MEKNKVIRFLNRYILFSNLDNVSLNTIANQLELETFNEGNLIIKQGDYGDKIYFLYEGSAEVFLLDHENKEIKVSELAVGDYFGELALLIDGIRTSSVRAISKCLVLSLSKEKFNAILATHLSVSKNLNQLLSKRLGETLHLVAKKKKNILITFLYAEDSEQRVADFENYLTKICKKPIINFHLPQQKELLAQKINELDNHIFLLKTKGEISTDSDYIVNFFDKTRGDFFLPAGTTSWQIEHVVRTIIKKRVGIALCCGGSLGVAHMSVLKTFAAHHIPLDFIVGSSAGALYGCCYAFGVSMDMLIDFMLKEKEKFNLWMLIKNFSFTSSGLMKNNYLRQMIRELLKDQLIENANIPFAAVASDFISGETVVIKSGSVIEGILASNAAPVLFEPVRKNHMLLIDGIATAPLPIQVLYDENIDIKIAVPIQQIDPNIKMTIHPKLYTVYLRSRAMMAERLVTLSSSLADVIIAPQIEYVGGLGWEYFDKILKAGEDAAMDAISKIKYLLEGH